MELATDSDLALALAMADSVCSISDGDDDFQHFSGSTNQLVILKSCGSFSGKRKRQKKDRTLRMPLRSSQGNSERDGNRPRENPKKVIVGKENRGDGLQNTAFKADECGKKDSHSCPSLSGRACRVSNTLTEIGVSKLDYRSTGGSGMADMQDVGVAVLELAHDGNMHVSPHRSEIVSLDKKVHELESENKEQLTVTLDEIETDAHMLEQVLPSAGKEQPLEVPAVAAKGQGLKHVVASSDLEEPLKAILSMNQQEEKGGMLEEVVSLAEDDGLLVSAVSSNMVEKNPAFSKSGTRDSQVSMIDSDVYSGAWLKQLSTPLTVVDNSGSQFSALLRLCIDAVIEDNQIANSEMVPSHMASARFHLCAEPTESSESDEHITSVMTQKTSLEFQDQSARAVYQQKAERLIQEGFGNKEPTKGDINLLESYKPLEANVDESPFIEHQGETSMAVDGDSAMNQREDYLECPICQSCITGMTHEERLVHTNTCLDGINQSQVEPLGKGDNNNEKREAVAPYDAGPILRWLEMLNLSRYADVFVREEIDWDTLTCLTDEDLDTLGIKALGPRRKMLCALQQLQKGTTDVANCSSKIMHDRVEADTSGKSLITNFFSRPSNLEENHLQNPMVSGSSAKSKAEGTVAVRERLWPQLGGIPEWMCIPGTKFRVDAFQYLRADCSHWFLTHFHTDHYQGLTRGFRYGHVYCSTVTAELVNKRIGVPWDCLRSLPLNEKVDIEGVKVTFIDANHCPGSVMILFELRNGKTVLHTGDFRFSEAMASNSVLQACNVHSLMLDTTYCNPQYDFPKQEVVIQFIIDAIQAEAFNPSTLFLIGTYTIGKERIFFEVAKVLQKKIYINATKLHLLECMGFSTEDMQWLTTNDQDAYIHVVPLWTIASFKRMKFVSRHYHGRYNSIVSFSPTGWSFGRGKKRTPGRRWQQGTLVRYEVPYSEHCSFKELREFVRFISPVNIIPSVHNDSAQAADALVALLLSEEETN